MVKMKWVPTATAYKAIVNAVWLYLKMILYKDSDPVQSGILCVCV